MYLRFVLPVVNEDTGLHEGVFQAAYELRREGELSEHEHTELSEILRWFGDNLEVPMRFNKSKSKGYWRRSTKGISWFKPSADEHIAKMRRMSDILREHGHHIRMLKTSSPGYVVYEDDYQVVAEPFNDTLE